MNATGSIRPKGSGFQWTYQNGDAFTFGFCNTLDEAKAALEAAESGEGYTVDDYFRVFMEGKTDLKPGTVNKYNLLYKSFIKPEIGNLPLENVSTGQLELLMTNVVKSDTSPLTCTVVSGLLGSIFRKAFHSRLIDKNPMENAELPKSRKKVIERSPFTEDQLKEFLKRAEKTNYWMMYRVAAYTGLRAGEVLGLMPEDIDKNMIHVRHNLIYLHRSFSIGTPKTETSRRTVPVSTALLAELKAYSETEEYREAHAKASAEWKNLIFLTKDGLPVNECAAANAFKRIVQRMKKEGILDPDGVYTFHSLRHTFASSLLVEGANPRIVQEMMGHADMKILQVYSHVSAEDEKKEMERLGRL